MSTTSPSIRQNVCYSVLEYAVQPALMLIAAPLLLRRLGVQQYGTWMLVNAVTATASGLGGGFGDGATKYVSMYRGRGDDQGAARSVSAVLIVNCFFGAVAALVMAAAAPWLIVHTFHLQGEFQHVGIECVRISAALLLVRFAEAVFTAAVRGCERYRPMVVISACGRISVVVGALVLAFRGHGLVAIFWLTLWFAVATLVGQAGLALNILQARIVWRWAEISAGVREVFPFGAFTWLKSTLGVAIGYADRLLVAALLGTAPLAFYSLCNQLTQPIHALTAAAFNFIFPNLSAQTASGQWADARRTYRKGVRLAGTMIALVSAFIVVLAKPLLRIWIGSAAAPEYHNLLIAVTLGNGVLALSVVPHYVTLALGRARALAIVNLVAGAVSLPGTYLLIKQTGILGAGVAKILGAAVFLSVFVIVRSELGRDSAESSTGTPSGLGVPSGDCTP